MRSTPLTVAALALCAAPLSAQSADSLIAKYIQASGGTARIQALQTLRRTGKDTGGGGFEAVVVQENKRPNSVREEFSIQGMTGINAYDGQTGWKIEPWQGKRDPEALGEDEMHGILDDADFDGPLVNYQAKGNKVEYQGIEQIEGSDAYKLKVTRPNGDVSFYYLDTEYYVPIRIDFGPRSPQHRIGGDERAHCGTRRGARRRAAHDLRRRGERRRVEVGERRHDVQAGVRQAAGPIDRCGNDRSQKP